MRDFIEAVRDYVSRHATQPAAKAVIDEANKLLSSGEQAIASSFATQTGGSMQGPLSSLIQDVRADVADIGEDVAALKDKALSIPMILRTVEDLVKTVGDLRAELAELKKMQQSSSSSTTEKNKS